MVMLCGFYPKIAKLIPNLSGWNYLTGLAKVRQDLVDGIIEDHANNRSDGHPRDYIDVYLSEVDKTGDETSSFHHSTASMLQQKRRNNKVNWCSTAMFNFNGNLSICLQTSLCNR